MSDLDRLKEAVCAVNKKIVEAGLVVLTWGNASGVDRASGLMVIKPSGVDYAALTPDDMVVVSLESGTVVEGALRPSSDTPTHVALYRAFQSIGGIVHTHSTYATSWAQSGRELPCLGTTHADHFHGTVPAARLLDDQELERYEAATGDAIVECFTSRGLDPAAIPAVLLPHHGPFAWGPDPRHALDNAIALEAVARMAAITFGINSGAKGIPANLLEKHYRRKHGAGAYYGQPKSNESHGKP